jgi:hypothetical protein
MGSQPANTSVPGGLHLLSDLVGRNFCAPGRLLSLCNLARRDTGRKIWHLISDLLAWH